MTTPNPASCALAPARANQRAWWQSLGLRHHYPVPPALALPPLTCASPFPCPVADDCSGHGKLDGDGKCVCDTPWPEAQQQGWTGLQCGIPVWGAATPLAGDDLTAWCRDKSCGSLAGGGWSCFAVRTAFK